MQTCLIFFLFFFPIYRTSAKYRYRFVCRKRSEKRSSAASNHSKADQKAAKGQQNGSLVGDITKDEEKQVLMPKPCGHCR